MAHEAYLSIKGTKQGQFKGQNIKSKRGDKWISVLAFEYSVESPRDASSGLPIGKRQHKPIVITKDSDSASPQIFRACRTNEILNEVVFEFAKASQGGEETIYHTITLTNATIVSFKTYTGALPPGAPHWPKYETVKLIFENQSVSGGGGAPANLGWVKYFGKWA